MRARRGVRGFIGRVVLLACIAGLLGYFFGGWAVLHAAPLPVDTICDDDQVCEPDQGEASRNCGDCPSVCGDGICASLELDTCGDGVCGALESFATCPLDCDPPTRIPTLAAPTQTATATSQDVQATEEETSSAPASDSPAPASTGTATVTPEEVIVSLETATATPEKSACEVVSVNEIAGAVVEAFVKQTQGYTAITWMRCREAPEEVCLPSDPVLGVGTDVLLQVALLDCDATGCEAISATSADDDQYCLEASIAKQAPDCADGCAFARFAPDAPESPDALSLPDLVMRLVFAVGTAAFILLVLLLVIMRRRRNQERKESMESKETTG